MQTPQKLKLGGGAVSDTTSTAVPVVNSFEVQFDNNEAVYIPDANNTAGGGGGPSSELLGYRLMLAAIYNDSDAFIQLSNCIQGGIWIGSKAVKYYYYSDEAGGDTCDSAGTDTNCRAWSVMDQGFSSSGLFPWVWKSQDTNNPLDSNLICNPEVFQSWDCAADGDINIALGYIYGSIAFGENQPVNKYIDPDDSNDPADSETVTIKQLRDDYIDAIRKNLLYYYGDSNGGNGVLLQDGYQANYSNKQAASTGGVGTDVWHTDYSDLRAFELFSYYDSNHKELWNNVYKSTITMFASILDVNDTRLIIDSNNFNDTNNPYEISFSPSENFAPANNSTLSYPIAIGDTNGYIGFLDNKADAYKNVGQFDTNVVRNSSNYMLNYNTDCCRMPIRLSYYLAGTRSNKEFKETPVFKDTISKISVNLQRFLADAYATGVPFAPDDSSGGSGTLLDPYVSCDTDSIFLGSGSLKSQTAFIFPWYVVKVKDGMYEYTNFIWDSSTYIQLNSAEEQINKYPTSSGVNPIPPKTGSGGIYNLKYGSFPGQSKSYMPFSTNDSNAFPNSDRGFIIPFTTAGLLALSPNDTSSGGLNFYQYLQPWIGIATSGGPFNSISDQGNYYNNSLTLWGLSNMTSNCSPKTDVINDINAIKPTW